MLKNYCKLTLLLDAAIILLSYQLDSCSSLTLGTDHIDMSHADQLVVALSDRPNIERPRWDQSTFWGRAKHFFTITNPANLLCTSTQLDEAKQVIEDFRHDKVEPHLTIDQLWHAKHVYDSAYHPDTKEKMLLIGRMSAQVPMNMVITGCMMTFYKTTPTVVFWQWINQSFNAIVNYTNRSGDNPIPTSQLLTSYCCATSGALAAALGLNSIVKSAPPLIGRFVPWVAVATANAINIPMMRSKEIQDGITVVDEKGNRLGQSQAVARRAIAQVVVSRICMATPGMMIPPFIMNYLDTKTWFKQRPMLGAPIQVGLVGFFLVFATPLCCALFPQISSVSVTQLEPELQEKIARLPNPPTIVYYNKGL